MIKLGRATKHQVGLALTVNDPKGAVLVVQVRKMLQLP